MDIYEYLKMDHQKISDLFKQFEAAKVFQRKKEIVAMIAQELTIHANSEEDTFYNLLEMFPESKEEAVHGEKEHQEIKTKIASAMKPHDSAAWEEQVKELKKLVEHHVKEEEGPLFKKAKKVISTEESYAIKEKMHHLKGLLLLDYQARVN